MPRKKAILICSSVLLTAAGCQMAKKAVSQPSTMQMLLPAYAASTQRFIALRHKLEVISPEETLPKAWQSAIDFCASIQCEVVSSSITTKTRESAPVGSMSLRVSPQDLQKLLAYVQTQGSIVQHMTQTDDKTGAVVDTDARIKNLTSFRDNLRTMLARQSGTIRDVVEIQKQLADTQSELDSETAQRKILANETEKVAVEISFRVERVASAAGGFAAIKNALSESGSVLAESTASLITVIVAVIPWLILIVPFCWLVSRAWRRLRRKKLAAAQQAPAAG
jgi:hypothetical protein